MKNINGYKQCTILPSAIYNFNIPHPLDAIIEEIIHVGGHPYLVGGAVLDIVCSSKIGGDIATIKDWDIEVFNISYEKLTRVLDDWGQSNLIGNKFGIAKLKLDGLDMEFSIPRLESKIGVKHQDFDIKLVPNLTIEEAARRRDFTINAIYFSLKNGKIYDPTGRGIKDIRTSTLDSVCVNTFADDPLRIMRAVQMMSRKTLHFTHDLETDIYMSIMEGMLKHVPGEAIFQEFNKMWMEANEDGILRALNFMEYTGIIEHFPELRAMERCEQKPEHHPEGNVWEHTKLVMAQATKYRDMLPEEWRLAYMWGMFVHDIGKPISVDPETGSMKGHDYRGAKLARVFMERLTLNKDLNDKICAIVEGHMRPRIMVDSNPKKSSWRRLQNICRLDILAYVSVADSDGRTPELREGTEAKWFRHVMDVYKQLGEQDGKIPPIVMGRHLIEKGMIPSIEFSSILQQAYEIQLDTGSESVEEILKIVLKGDTNE